MNVYFPGRLNAGTMHKLISPLVDERRKAKSHLVTFDFSSLVFIDPVGITVLSNLIELLKKQGAKVQFRHHSYSTKATRFLDDSLFFEHYLNKKVFPGSNPRPTTLPLCRLGHKDTHSWIANTLIPWLELRLDIDARSLEIIKTCLAELFNNIIDHSREDIGSVFVQQYPQKKLINIALSDFGVGIPHTVFGAYQVYQYKAAKPKTDGEAILLSTSEGFSSHSSLRNRGVGLATFLDILAGNKGTVVIYSNQGALRCRPNIRDQLATLGYYPGTLFDINFRTDTIRVEDAEEETFAWGG